MSKEEFLKLVEKLLIPGYNIVTKVHGVYHEYGVYSIIKQGYRIELGFELEEHAPYISDYKKTWWFMEDIADDMGLDYNEIVKNNSYSENLAIINKWAEDDE